MWYNIIWKIKTPKVQNNRILTTLITYFSCTKNVRLRSTQTSTFIPTTNAIVLCASSGWVRLPKPKTFVSTVSTMNLVMIVLLRVVLMRICWVRRVSSRTSNSWVSAWNSNYHNEMVSLSAFEWWIHYSFIIRIHVYWSIMIGIGILSYRRRDRCKNIVHIKLRLCNLLEMRNFFISRRLNYDTELRT